MNDGVAKTWPPFGRGVPALTESPPYFGYHGTCWQTWPESWVPCDYTPANLLHPQVEVLDDPAHQPLPPAINPGDPSPDGAVSGELESDPHAGPEGARQQPTEGQPQETQQSPMFQVEESPPMVFPGASDQGALRGESPAVQFASHASYQEPVPVAPARQLSRLPPVDTDRPPRLLTSAENTID